MLVPRSLDDQGITTKPEEEEDKVFYDCFVQGESMFRVLLHLYLAQQSLVQRGDSRFLKDRRCHKIFALPLGIVLEIIIIYIDISSSYMCVSFLRF